MDQMPGTEETFQTYTHWANLSNAPFRLYKSWVHEGGISTPLIVRWNSKTHGEINRRKGHLIDIAATIYDVTKTPYPAVQDGTEIIPLEGESIFAPYDMKRPMFWEHQGNGAVQIGKWKAVCEYPKEWELYDMENDRCELLDLSRERGDILTQLVSCYYEWANRCGVLPRDRILAIPGRRTIHNEYCDWMI